MYSSSTRNEFLRLRIAGLSFARIARQLGVSKPTLIAWSRVSQPELDSARAEVQQRLQEEVTSANQELAEIKRRHRALRQELLSRSLRDVPTACIETLAGELHKRIEHLESTTCSSRGQPSEVLSTKDGEEAQTSSESSTHSAIPTPNSALEEPIRT